MTTKEIKEEIENYHKAVAMAEKFNIMFKKHQGHKENLEKIIKKVYELNTVRAKHDTYVVFTNGLYLYHTNLDYPYISVNTYKYEMAKRQLSLNEKADKIEKMLDELCPNPYIPVNFMIPVPF